MSNRAFSFLAFVVALFVNEAAIAGTYPVTVESGGSVTVEVLDKDKAPSAAVLEKVGNAAHGTPGITADKRSVTFSPAGNYTGSDAFTYSGRDPATSQEYSGRVDVSIVAPQRIVTFDYKRVAGVLGIILVLALVVEVGLATLFNWKYFQERWEGRGVRTPIAVVVSAFFTFFYRLDIVSDLLSAFTEASAPFAKSLPGYVVTARQRHGESAVCRVRPAAAGAGYRR